MDRRIDWIESPYKAFILLVSSACSILPSAASSWNQQRRLLVKLQSSKNQSGCAYLRKSWLPGTLDHEPANNIMRDHCLHFVTSPHQLHQVLIVNIAHFYDHMASEPSRHSGKAQYNSQGLGIAL
jgi:hypothetical protein